MQGELIPKQGELIPKQGMQHLTNMLRHSHRAENVHTHASDGTPETHTMHTANLWSGLSQCTLRGLA